MGDAHDLAEKVDRALTDTDFRARCREDVAPLLEAYAWDTLGAQTAELYDRVAAEHNRRR
jgi:glycosyltransferase involved in cell wall biosynthesis